jgi:hypothetical protein
MGLAEMPVFISVAFDNENISFHLSDKRIITIPLSWIPKLEKANSDIRETYIIRGHFVFWEDVDEIIGVMILLIGTIVPT